MVLSLQAVTVPVQGAFQVQPYSLPHELESVLELHAVTVPVHGALQTQPPWEVQALWVVSEEQAVSVPVQGTDQPQPAFVHRAEDWYVEQSEGVPEQVFVPAVHEQPMLRQSTW